MRNIENFYKANLNRIKEGFYFTTDNEKMDLYNAELETFGNIIVRAKKGLLTYKYYEVTTGIKIPRIGLGVLDELHVPISGARIGDEILEPVTDDELVKYYNKNNNEQHLVLLHNFMAEANKRLKKAKAIKDVNKNIKKFGMGL